MKQMNKVFFIVFCMILSFTQICLAQYHRDKRDQPEKLLDIAGVKPGMFIGEAGAGEGYLTFFLSRRVGKKGKIYANDINAKALQKIKTRCKMEDVKNIETVLGRISDPCFPTKLDQIIMLFAFHDFTEKEAWLNNVKKYMKEHTNVVIFDRQDTHTGMSKKLVSELGENAGFKLVRHDRLHNGIWIYILNIDPL